MKKTLGQIRMLWSCAGQGNKDNPTLTFRASAYCPLGKKNVSLHRMKYCKSKTVTWEGQWLGCGHTSWQKLYMPSTLPSCNFLQNHKISSHRHLKHSLSIWTDDRNHSGLCMFKIWQTTSPNQADSIQLRTKPELLLDIMDHLHHRSSK